MIQTTRTPSPPKSLKSKTTYKAQDVCEQLREDFYGKCYLCEREIGAEIQVEHLRPKAGYPHLEFEWTNLFPACTCNQRRLKWSGRSETDATGKPTGFPIGGMLDPAVDKIEERLIQRPVIGVSVQESRVEFFAGDKNDLAACNTAEELNAIHNQGKTGHVLRLKEQIRNHVAFIYKKMSEYLEAITIKDENLIAELTREISFWTKPSAPFAGLVRGMLRRDFRSETIVPFGL